MRFKSLTDSNYHKYKKQSSGILSEVKDMKMEEVKEPRIPFTKIEPNTSNYANAPVQFYHPPELIKSHSFYNKLSDESKPHSEELGMLNYSYDNIQGTQGLENSSVIFPEPAVKEMMAPQNIIKEKEEEAKEVATSKCKCNCKKSMCLKLY